MKRHEEYLEEKKRETERIERDRQSALVRKQIEVEASERKG